MREPRYIDINGVRCKVTEWSVPSYEVDPDFVAAGSRLPSNPKFGDQFILTKEQPMRSKQIARAYETAFLTHLRLQDKLAEAQDECRRLSKAHDTCQALLNDTRNELHDALLDHPHLEWKHSAVLAKAELRAVQAYAKEM